MTVSSTNFTSPDDDPPKTTEIYIFSGKQVRWVGVQNTIKQQTTTTAAAPHKTFCQRRSSEKGKVLGFRV
jgi:hypothetical protein